MLIQFTVGNYLSFKDKVTFSMVAAPKMETLEENTFKATDKIELLKTAAIYGANASGKSNLIKSIEFMRYFVLYSVNRSADKIHNSYFKLCAGNEKLPSFFEAVFILSNDIYRYGFAITGTEVLQEYLYITKKGSRESRIFTRDNQVFKLNRNFKKEGKNLIEKTRINALFLSVIAQFNGNISLKVSNWFKNIIIIRDFRKRYNYVTNRVINNKIYKKEVINFINLFDINIEDIIKVEKPFTDEFLKNIKNEKEREYKMEAYKNKNVVSLSMLHHKYNNEGKYIGGAPLDFQFEESDGTQRLYALTGILLSVFSMHYIIIIDEFENRLHPLTAKLIIEMFNNKKFNRKNSQLVLASHNNFLLSNEIFRRDQIWFTEKDKYGATDLYSLAEFKIRSDESYGKNYINGKYGAIPFISNNELVFEDNINEEKKAKRK